MYSTLVTTHQNITILHPLLHINTSSLRPRPDPFPSQLLHPISALLSQSQTQQPSKSMTDQDYIPSPDRLLQLSTIALRSSPPPTPLSILLAPILPPLQHADILPYLLTEDPLHINPLSSPTLFNNSFTFKLAITRTPSHSLLPTPYPTAHYDNDLLFCPAFNTGPWTIGTGVMQITTRTATLFNLAQLAPAVEFLNFRFVVDMQRMFFMMLYEFPEKDVSLIFYSHRIDTRCTRALTLMFERSTLRPILKEKRSNLSTADIQPSLQLYQHEFATQPCTVCGDTSLVSCACTFSLERGAHPMDTNQFIRAIQPHLGPAQCPMSQVVFDNGRGIRQDTLGSLIQFDGVLDLDLVRRLADWSLGDYVKGAIEVPQPSLTYHQDAYVNSKQSKLDFKRVGGDALMCICTGSGKSSGMGDVKFSIIDLDITGHSDMPLPKNSTAGVEESSNSTVPQSIKDGSGSASKRSEGGAVTDDKEAKLKARQKLLADRRERNRASAQRSNRKRKMAFESLQEELDNYRDRVNILRQKEMALRRENLELRKSMT